MAENSIVVGMAVVDAISDTAVRAVGVANTVCGDDERDEEPLHLMLLTWSPLRSLFFSDYLACR